MKHYTFSKAEKLKSKAQIERLFLEGKSVTFYPLKLIYQSTPLVTHKGIIASVSVSKKLYKKATDRNRIKRLLREAYRLNKPMVFNNIEGDFAVMILYLGKEMPSFEKMNSHMKRLLEKFITSIKE
jgi:ribonuclease P protein component